MTTAHEWNQTGACVACGAPIYTRSWKQGWVNMAQGAQVAGAYQERDEVQVRRGCPPSCPHGSRAFVRDGDVHIS